jgi:putative membrane protein
VRTLPEKPMRGAHTAEKGVNTMMWYGDGWAGWAMMAVAMALFWAVLIAAAVWGIRALSGSGGRPQTQARVPVPPRPDNLLNQRFARGEIDEDEFRRSMALLRETR